MDVWGCIVNNLWVVWVGIFYISIFVCIYIFLYFFMIVVNNNIRRDLIFNCSLCVIFGFGVYFFDLY